MTCVIALSTNDGRVILGGDSFCGDEETLNVCPTPKVYKINSVGIGLCGDVRSEQILERTARYHLSKKEKITEKWLINSFTDAVRKAMKKHGCLSDKDGIHEMKDNSAYLLTFNGKIYFFEENFALWESARPYAAIGAGKQIACGALSYAFKHGYHNENPKEVAKTALESAAEWSPWVCGPYTIIEVDDE